MKNLKVGSPQENTAEEVDNFVQIEDSVGSSAVCGIDGECY